MEPIRPDDDELRAGIAQTSKSQEKKPGPERPAKTTPPPRGPDRKQPNTPPQPPSGGSGKLMGLLVMLLVVSVAAGAGLVWQQAQRLAAMEEQVEEADYWVRQSKLALARFEGELTETGESLQQRGSTIEQRLAEQTAQIATANSEIRKLWVIANERNKALLEQQGKQIAALEEVSGGQAGSLDELGKAQETLQSGIGNLGDTVTSLEVQADTLASNDERVRSQLEKLVSDISAVKAGVEQSLQRFNREQGLTIEGMESRLNALENAQGSAATSGSRLDKTEARLASLEETIKSIDASRAQLTSRLVRLSEQVDAMR